MAFHVNLLHMKSQTSFSQKNTKKKKIVCFKGTEKRIKFYLHVSIYTATTSFSEYYMQVFLGRKQY